jgi:hypothetical protein
VPNLPREGAGDEQMMHCLRLLVAQDAPGIVLQALALKSIGSPAPVLVGQPEEEFDEGRRPDLPD